MVKTDVLDQNQSNQCHKYVSFTQECMESVPIFLLQYIFDVNIDEIIKKIPLLVNCETTVPHTENGFHHRNHALDLISILKMGVVTKKN